MGGWQDRGSLRVCVFVLLRGILLSVCVCHRGNAMLLRMNQVLGIHAY